MGSRGPAKEPIELARLKGNPGRRPLPDIATTIALAPADGIPEPPESLGGVGVETWNRIWTSIANLWISPETDVITVETVCHLTEQAAICREVISQMPFTVEPINSARGEAMGERMVASPAWKVLRDVEKQLAQELGRLGLNPTARRELGLAEIKATSKLQDLADRAARRRVDQSAEIVDLIPD